MSGRTASGWILAIDTSTEQAGLALSNGRQTAERSWAAGRTQTTTVLPAIGQMLEQIGIGVGDLSAIAIATGPGTFTGLRVGISIAKGLVLAREIPLIGVPTLDITTATVHGAEPDVVAMLPAGRGRVVWQRYGNDADPEPHNTTVPELIDALAESPQALVVGELSDEHRAMIEQAHARVRWAFRSPASLAELARKRLDAGDVDDPVLLEPRYLHGVTVHARPIQDRLKRRP